MSQEVFAKLLEIKEAQVAFINEQKQVWQTWATAQEAKGADVNTIRQMLERAIARLDTMEQELTRVPLATALPSTKSITDRFRESTDYKHWVENVGRAQKSSFSMRMESLWPPELQLKTTITSATIGSSTPGILIPERVPGIVKPGVRAMRVRDLIPRFPTLNNAVEWVKENVFTNLASPIAETISKPESALTFTIDSASVRTIAHWIPAAKQVLDDFGLLQAYVEMRLLEGLKDIEDYELVAGDGTGQHLSGFSTEAAAYDTARSVASDTKLDTLNHAISQIEDVHHNADGIILHPRDWRAIQLLKTEEGGTNKGSYLVGGPTGEAAPIIWGVPVATTTAVTKGTFYVGAFQRFTALFDRMEARVDVSTEHADFFIRNLVAIRAEERLALAVYRSDAVIYGSFPS